MGMAFPLQHPLHWSHWWEMQGKLTVPAHSKQLATSPHQSSMVDRFFFKLYLLFLALVARLYGLSQCSLSSS